MAISDFLTPEQANQLLDQQFNSPQGIARLNPLAFKYQNAIYPYEDFIGAYSQIDPNAPMYEDFSKPQPDFINASPQDDYASYSLPKLDTSRFADVDLESGYLDRAGSYGQDVYAEQEKQKGDGIGGLFRFLLGLAVPGSGLFMGDTSALQGIRNLNQRLRNTDFGQSKTLQEYFQRREARKDAERLQTVGQQLQQASERGGGYQPTTTAQNIARTESRVSGGKTRAYGL